MGRSETESRPMPPYLMPLQQPNRLDGHGMFGDRKPPNAPLPITITATENVRNRTPSHAPVPNAVTATEPIGWTWDVRRQKAAQCPRA
ncbi:hypothetical protein AVEN_102614-1 [Araneus ventricosus]|uniref:Uncharacterized protein n=1 Tax=Araneus ventricosus TaxID=182803 RepID=A0A4Y2BJ47_ARAVE|nr:hypothetical protein AVEN_102614-1 [Araneus ventricosus]